MMPRRRIGREPEAVLVELDESSPKELKTFHCPGCGFVICQYYTRLKMIIAGTAISPSNQLIGLIGGKKGKAPIIIQCHNSRCRLRLNIR